MSTFFFRRKVFSTRSLSSTTGICIEDEECDEMSLVEVLESGSSSFCEVSEVASLVSNLHDRSNVITSVEVVGSDRRLGDASSLAGLTLDLLMILFVELLRILKVTS